MNRHVARAELVNAAPVVDIGITDARQIADACHRTERALVLLMGTARYHDPAFYQTRVDAAKQAIKDLTEALANG